MDYFLYLVVLQNDQVIIINKAADQIDGNYDDLTMFNQQNILLSLQRAKTEADVKQVKQFYGIP